MNFIDLFLKKEPKTIVQPIEVAQINNEMNIISLSKIEMPLISENKREEWVNFGEDNTYPQLLLELTRESAIHQAILQSKSLMVGGQEFLFNKTKTQIASDEFVNSLLPNQKDELNRLLNEPNQKEQSLHDIVMLLATDYETFGAFAVEVIWNNDFTMIAEINRVEVENIRCGKMVDGRVNTYWYSRDWSRNYIKRNPPISIAAFDSENKTDASQLIYVKNDKAGFEYYGIPNYFACLSYIKVDTELAKYYLSTIQNGFNPSLAIKFYTLPGSPEEKSQIAASIKSQFGSTRNSGKAMIFFSDGKELAPDVTPIDVTNLDKQYLAMAEQVIQQILSGHRVTSSELFGIQVPGKLGDSNLDVSYNIFLNTVIKPDSAKIEKVLTKIFKINGLNFNVDIQPLNPIILNQ